MVIMKKTILAISLLLIVPLMIGTPTALSGGKKAFVMEITIDEDGMVHRVKVNDITVDKAKFPLPPGTINAATSMQVFCISKGNPTCYFTIVINGVPYVFPYNCP